MKEIDLKKSVADLVDEYPEIKGIMAEIGFKEITNPMALQIMGRIMTIPRGCVVKGIPLEKVKEEFKSRGFTIKGEDPGTREKLLRQYLERLQQGEDIDSVRKDFVENFQDVDAQEIAAAEQSLIKSGISPLEVQKLCDVHSALFYGSHGDTELAKAQTVVEPQKKDGKELADGHPLHLLSMENKALEEIVKSLKEAEQKEDTAAVLTVLKSLFGLYVHYAKKEELLMPLLYDYGVTGPSQVMWGVDDEIKHELVAIVKSLQKDEENFVIYRGRISQLANRILDMVTKEEKILFPLTLRFFTQKEWQSVYADCFEMGMAFIDIDAMPRWSEGEEYRKTLVLPEKVLAGKVEFENGSVTVGALISILKLLDVDITYIDNDDILRWFVNEGKIFSRPHSAIGREVFRCHSPSVLPVVRQLLLDFKAKKRRSMEVYRNIQGRPVSVRYLAIYDESDEYVGTVEFVQDCTKFLEHFRESKA